MPNFRSTARLGALILALATALPGAMAMPGAPAFAQGADAATALFQAIAGTMTIDGPSRDPGHGYTPEAAIPVGGGAAASGGENFRVQVFFKLLSGPLGEDPKVVLEGKCCAERAGGSPVQVYSVVLPGRRPFRMFLDTEREGRLLAPMGLAYARSFANRLTIVQATRAVAERIDRKARRLLAPPVKDGEVLALYYQGLLDLAGRGGPVDTTRALTAFQVAASRGHGPSQRMLAEMFAEGRGVPANADTALGWYRRAAFSGDREAQAILASRYLLGDGVPADPGEAIFWSRAAADRGLGEAQMILASIMLTGADGSRREDEGLMWLTLADRAGVPRARDRLAEARKSQPAGALLKARDAAARWGRSLGPPPVPDIGVTGVSPTRE